MMMPMDASSADTCCANAAPTSPVPDETETFDDGVTSTRWVEPGVLYLVATPIGNLADMSPRAVAVLKGVQVIACEDTRHARKLLDHFGVRQRVVALHEHNEASRVATVAEWLSEGQSVALISDAGTPAISDPGSLLVRRLVEQGHRVSPIPGACAAITALSASGLDSTHFWFEGFLPAKAQARAARLQALSVQPATLIFYEAPHRIRAMLEAAREHLGEARRAVVGRELTKRFETLVSGDLGYLSAAVQSGEIPERGEFVVLVEGAEPVELPPRHRGWMSNNCLRSCWPKRHRPA